MKKSFCDLCGAPAMDTGFTELFYKRNDNPHRRGYHLCVEFTIARDYHPKAGDERGDICLSCMAGGLRAIVRQLEEKAVDDAHAASDIAAAIEERGKGEPNDTGN